MELKTEIRDGKRYTWAVQTEEEKAAMKKKREEMEAKRKEIMEERKKKMEARLQQVS